MKKSDMHIIIIGNGIAGITAARFIRKYANYRITVISEETDYFFSRTALMYIYMGDLTFEQTKPYEDWFWDKNRIDRVRARVTSINFEKKALQLNNSRALHYDKLLLATGSRNNRMGVEGEEFEGVQMLYAIQDLERMEAHTKDISRAVIIGGGLIGVEMAEMLHSRKIPVTFLAREPEYWSNVLPMEEAAMLSRHIREHDIDLHCSTELKAIRGDAQGRVRQVVTKEGRAIPAQFVGITIGVHPNISLVKNTSLETDKGILVNDKLETNIPDVYAAGDCVQVRKPRPGRKAIEPVWYTGRAQGKVAGLNLCGMEMDYDPGVWFNSAKFFDIEYQVYGQIPPQVPEDTHTLFWEHPDGRKAIRINYKKDGHRVTGFNLMGVRYRHEVCAAWLKNGTPVEQVLKNLKKANFDPEFFARHEPQLIRKYNEAHPEQPLRIARKKSWLAGLTGG